MFNSAVVEMIGEGSKDGVRGDDEDMFIGIDWAKSVYAEHYDKDEALVCCRLFVCGFYFNFRFMTVVFSANPILSVRCDHKHFQSVKLSSTVKDSRTEKAGEKRLTLDDCLKLFAMNEKLGKNDPWYCPRCRVCFSSDVGSIPSHFVFLILAFRS